MCRGRLVVPDLLCEPSEVRVVLACPQVLKAGWVVLLTGEPERAGAGQRFAVDREGLCSYGVAGLVDGGPDTAECVCEEPVIAVTGDTGGVHIAVTPEVEMSVGRPPLRSHSWL